MALRSRTLGKAAASAVYAIVALPALSPLGLSACLGLFAPLAAQQATIAGRVTDLETGSPVADAAVEVLGQSAGPVATSEAGAFRVSVPLGTHSILVTRIGYETSRTDGVTVEAGGTASVTIELRTRPWLSTSWS